MPVHLSKRDARTEAKDAFDRHIAILQDVDKWCIQTNEDKEEFFYLAAIPIIYSAWEGYFRLTCSVCLRRLCERGAKVKKYKHPYATLWLQRESFLDMFLKALLNTMALGKDVKKLSSGKFEALSTFKANINHWLEGPLNHAINFDDLVMTYSNVNTEVAKLNGSIIGLDMAAVDFSKLDELLGRRNNICHGGLVNYTKEGTAKDLLMYTQNLLSQFHQSVVNWINNT